MPSRNMHYPIRTIATMTGVKPVTLRAWETRYGLLKPIRTESGHRLYTDRDIETVQKALALRARGIPIRQVPELLKQGEGTEGADRIWIAQRDHMLTAIGQFDEMELDRMYQKVMGLHPITTIIKQLIEPVLITLGQRWDKVPGGIAEEHFFSVYISHKLEARFQQQFGRATGPLIVCACLPQETHNLGLSLFCLAAHESNFRIINLGANTPLKHLEVVCHRREPAGVVLAGLLEPSAQTVSELKHMVSSIEPPVLIGGQASLSAKQAIESCGAIALGTDTSSALRDLTQIITSLGPGRELES